MFCAVKLFQLPSSEVMLLLTCGCSVGLKTRLQKPQEAGFVRLRRQIVDRSMIADCSEVGGEWLVLPVWRQKASGASKQQLQPKATRVETLRESQSRSSILYKLNSHSLVTHSLAHSQ